MSLALCAPRVDCIAVAIPGADTWRDTQADLARGRNAVVALDADKAGVLHRRIRHRSLVQP